MSMTKAEARKMARLEAENAELRAKMEHVQSRNMSSVRELVAYRVAFVELAETIESAKEFAR